MKELFVIVFPGCGAGACQTQSEISGEKLMTLTGM